MNIHPHVFRSILGRHAQIVEYQVRQTLHGADLRCVTSAELDTLEVERRLEKALGALGIHRPKVAVTLVTALDRQKSGKLKRFPLSI